MDENNTKVRFLQECKDSKAEVNFIMRTGFQHHGRVLEFDSTTILAEVNQAKKLLYQAAISTIEPYVQHYAPRQHYTDATWDSPARGFLRDP